MNHVEAKILELVAQLYPAIFAALDAYCVKHANFLDETLATLDREVQFYVAYLEYLYAFKRVGLAFCYPLNVKVRRLRGRSFRPSVKNAARSSM